MRDPSKNIARNRHIEYGVNDKLSKLAVDYSVSHGLTQSDVVQLLEGLEAKPSSNP